MSSEQGISIEEMETLRRNFEEVRNSFEGISLEEASKAFSLISKLITENDSLSDVREVAELLGHETIYDTYTGNLDCSCGETDIDDEHLVQVVQDKERELESFALALRHQQQGKTYDQLICRLCNDVVRYGVTITHRYRDSTIAFDVCPGCAKRREPLCEQNYYGVHGEVIDADEDPIGVGLTLAKLSNLGPRDAFVHKIIPRHQIGYCANCKNSMVWDVDLQRWRALQ